MSWFPGIVECRSTTAYCKEGVIFFLFFVSMICFLVNVFVCVCASCLNIYVFFIFIISRRMIHLISQTKFFLQRRDFAHIPIFKMKPFLISKLHFEYTFHHWPSGQNQSNAPSAFWPTRPRWLLVVTEWDVVRFLFQPTVIQVAEPGDTGAMCVTLHHPVLLSMHTSMMARPNVISHHHDGCLFNNSSWTEVWISAPCVTPSFSLPLFFTSDSMVMVLLKSSMVREHWKHEWL